MNAIQSILNLTVDDLVSSYTGKAGHCCCGCAGKHWYKSTMRKAAGKWRGYEIDDDEISDVAVKRALRRVQRIASSDDRMGWELSVISGECISVEKGNSLTILYLWPASKIATR